MRRRLSIFALLAAWLCANGALWDVVQGVAWVRMFNDYAQVMPATQALRLTFGGAPCGLCETVQRGRESSEQSSAPTVSASAEKILLMKPQVCGIVVVAPRPTDWPASMNKIGLMRAEPVWLRPPRV